MRSAVAGSADEVLRLLQMRSRIRSPNTSGSFFGSRFFFFSSCITCWITLDHRFVVAGDVPFSVVGFGDERDKAVGDLFSGVLTAVKLILMKALHKHSML